jgi:glycosyltransferase involved in cell wall biosynthesis
MRIAIDGALLDRKVTGSERYIHNLFSSLCLFGARNDYTIYTGQPIFPPELLPHNAAERSFASRSEMILEEFLPEGKPAMELYHMTWFGANYVDLAPLFLAPLSVLTVLDLMLFRYPDYFDDLAASQDYQERCRLAISASDMILAISNHTRSEILANFPVEAEKVKVIPLGTDDRFHKLADEESINRVRSRYGLDEPFILYVGTDYPHKN